MYFGCRITGKRIIFMEKSATCDKLYYGFLNDVRSVNMSKTNIVNFQLNDISNIADFLCGKYVYSIASDYILPQELVFEEETLYELCFDHELDSSFLAETSVLSVAITKLISIFIEQYGFAKFLSFVLGSYIDNKTMLLTERGYDVFLIKSEMLKKINSLWSIENQEFAYISDGCWEEIEVRFKEYDKLGEGGFSTVYRYSKDNVCKVLNHREKSSASSVHRFKREFEIMQQHNYSGYTINVSDYEATNLVYQMERATISLEEYIESKVISEEEKDSIILRCIECMLYLHSNNVVHRDFHPGNILKNSKGEWVVTDFGLAKALTEKYSRVTNSTRAVGRFWYTDPIQLGALKEGTYTTDLYSLAKTIDFVFNGNQSQSPNKYTAIINKATAPRIDDRYTSIEDLKKDIQNIIDRQEYQSPQEVVSNLLQTFKRTGNFDDVAFANILSKDSENELIWDLVIAFGNDLVLPYISLSKTNYDLCYTTIGKLKDCLSIYRPWAEYDTVAYWAASVLRTRTKIDDGISAVAVSIVEYVASNVGRYRIMSLANSLKYDTNIDAHIRSQLTYHDGY